MPQYTRSQLLQSVKGRVFNKTGMLVDYGTCLNNSVREVMNDVDLLSTKRKVSVPSAVFSEIYSYPCPTDLNFLIDVQPQVNKARLAWTLTSEEEFNRRTADSNNFHNDYYNYYNQRSDNLLAFADSDLRKKLLISNAPQGGYVVLDNLDTVGTWTAFGDGTNLSTDTGNYMNGAGSVKWDINAAAGTTAGIEGAITSQDISSYLDVGSAFIWVYITSITGLTNFKLRLGSSSTVYHEYTITTDNENNSFITGWNLLRFNLQNPTDTGVPTDTAIDYAAVFMTKAITKVSEVDYRFDWLVLNKGNLYNVVYYSNYLWQSNLGVWKIDSTSDQDYLNITNSEYSLIIEKATELASYELAEEKSAGIAANRYQKLLDTYQKGYKSEKLRTITQYYNLGSGK